jgi:glycosyltransferase involved in cell wall biosynthesis
MNLILAHDSLTQAGGAERVVLEWMELFPSSPLYVLVADKKILDGLPEHVRIRVKTTPLQYLYNIYPHFQHLLPFIPLALWLTRIPECDVLLSSSSAFAKGFRLDNAGLSLRGGLATKQSRFITAGLLRRSQGGTSRNDSKRAVHINYCHTPTRFLWSDREYVEQEVPWIVRIPAKIFLWWMKGWDLRAAARVDKFLANSKEVQKRIKKYYNRDSEVVYPFVAVEKWQSPFPVIPCPDTGSLLESKSVGILAGVKIIKDSGSHSQTRLSGMTDKKDSYFLIAGRLHAHKHNDLVIEVCNELKINLHVVGQGRDEEHLKAIAGPTIKFLGRISDAELQKEYAEAMAYIYPQLEDFGLMPVEAAASGTPTIGANVGGSLETIIPGKTGEWFNFGDKESLRTVLQAWDKTRYTKEDLLRHAENFSKEKFDEKITRIVNIE